jgi:hypothetical protein
LAARHGPRYWRPDVLLPLLVSEFGYTIKGGGAATDREALKAFAVLLRQGAEGRRIGSIEGRHVTPSVKSVCFCAMSSAPSTMDVMTAQDMMETKGEGVCTGCSHHRTIIACCVLALHPGFPHCPP